MDRAARLTALSARFTKAVLRAQELEQSGELTEERTVALYGLMIQATAGDCRASTAPPSKASDAKGGRSDDALRWMAWKKKAGMSREAAMIAYVDQVQLIDEELSTNGAALLDSTGSAGYFSSGGDIYRSSDGLGQNGRAGSVYKTGTLYKQRDVFKGWRPRTFVLQDRLLRYYLHNDDPVARGTLSLEGCLVNPVNDRPPTTKKIEGEVVEVFPFVISHPDSSRTYSLAAKTKEEADEWITALRAAAAPEARRSLRRKVSLENSRLFKMSDSAGAATDMSVSSNATDYAGMRGDGTLSPPPTTVMAPPHLAGKIAEALVALRETTSSLDKWEHVICRHDVEVYRRPGLWQSVRGEGSIPHHPVSVLMAVLDLDKRREYDSHLDFGRRLQVFSPHTSLDYHHWKAVWPTKARDMYNVIHWQVEEGGEITIVTFSDSGKYPDEAGVIRAECILAGWVIRPVLQDEDTGMQNGHGAWHQDELKLHSRVSYLVQTDLKGKLPHSIRSHVSESQPMLIAALSKFLKERKEYACDLPLGYTNQQVEPLMDALNRRVVAAEVPDRKPLHQTSMSIQEIQAELPPLVSAKVEDAVHALIEGEVKRAGWEQVLERDGDRAYQKEADATDVGVLHMRTEGVIHHPPAAVLQAITTLDLVNIWSGTREFSTHDTLFNVHTWITYQRLQALFPMPTRDACQLVHWRVIEDGKRVVVVAVDDNFHPEEDGYVRAHVTEGWVLDSVDGGEATRVCCMYTLDIKGVMTLAVRLELSQKQGSVISCVRKFLNEYRAPGGTKPRIGPPLDQVKLTNHALEPLVIAWNRWSPTLVPARVKPPEPPRHHARRSLDGARRLSAAPPLPRPRLNRSNSAPVSSLEGLAASGPQPRPQLQQQQQQPHNRRVSFNGPTPGQSARSSSPPRGHTQGGATSASAGSPSSAASRTSSPSLLTLRPSSPLASTSTRGHATSNGHDDRALLHGTEIPTHAQHQQHHHPPQHPLRSRASVWVDRASALAGAIRSALASTVLDDNSPLLAKPALHFFALYLPVLIFVGFRVSSTFRDYAPVYFILSVVLAVRYVMTGHPLRPYAVSLRGTEWGQETFKSKVRVRFPVEVKRIKRYIEGKQKETGVDVTVLHVAMRAVAVALRQVPELNGHTVMGTFFKSRTCDVSCEVRLKDGTYALIKVADADRKSAPEIARMLQAKSDVVTSGTDPFHARRQLILQSCPAYVCYMLDCLFTYLGAGLGLCIPALGVRGFPQGTCVVVTSPAVFSHRTTSESDFVIEPEGATGEILSPILLTVGAISSMPKAEGPQQMVMVPVLDVSMLVRVQGAGLHHVRRLSDLVQKYMSDPRHLDTYAANNRVVASGDVGQCQQQSPAAAEHGDDGTDVQSVRSSLSIPE